MVRFDEGLRCQDVHAGLRNVDPNSGTLTPLADTQLIGMAASVAALIRGQDVIVDPRRCARSSRSSWTSTSTPSTW